MWGEGKEPKKPTAEYFMTPVIFQAIHELFPHHEIRTRARSTPLEIYSESAFCGRRPVNCEIDFYIPGKKLFVEYVTTDSGHYLIEKQEWCHSNGFTFIIISAHIDSDLSLEAIKSKISRIMDGDIEQYSLSPTWNVSTYVCVNSQERN